MGAKTIRKQPKKRTNTRSSRKATPKTDHLPATSTRPKAPVAASEPVTPPVTSAASVASSRSRLPSAWTIGRMALTTLWTYKRLFFGIMALYVVLNFIFVRGLSNSSVDVGSLKSIMSGNFSGGLSQLWTGLSMFTVLVSASTTVTGAATGYQIILLLIFSLAIVWGLRQVLAGQKPVRIRDCFYKGMYPLIPVVFVILIMTLQLLPFVFGGYIYGLVISSSIAVHLIEKILWACVLLAGTAASLYLLSSSVFGLYICALPDMTPLKALRSARELIKFRRWAVLRKLLFLPVMLFIVGAVLMTPVLLYATGLAQSVFFLLSLVAVILAHAYMYTLYRELLT